MEHTLNKYNEEEAKARYIKADYKIFVDKYISLINGEEHLFYVYMDYYISEFSLYTDSQELAQGLFLRPKTEEEYLAMAVRLWKVIDGGKMVSRRIYDRPFDKAELYYLRQKMEGTNLWRCKFYTFSMDEYRRLSHPEHKPPQWYRDQE